MGLVRLVLGPDLGFVRWREAKVQLRVECGHLFPAEFRMIIVVDAGEEGFGIGAGPVLPMDIRVIIMDYLRIERAQYWE